MTNPIRELAAELRGLRRRVHALETTPQLDHSSIEDGAVDVNDADGNLSAVLGRQFDATYTAASVAGPAPPVPTAPVVQDAVAGLTVTWDGLFADPDAVAPMDFVRVDVHTSMTSGFDAVATQPRYSFTSPRGGSCYVPLIEGQHYVALVTRTESGRASVQSAEVAGTSRKVSGEDLADDYVYPGEIPIDQITSGLLNAVIQTAESGPRVRLSDLYGFQVIDDSDSAIVDFPADGSRPAQITADLIAHSLTALGNLSIRGTGNEITASGELALSAGVTAPMTAATVAQHYDMQQFPPPPDSEPAVRGLAYGDGYWWRSINVLGSSTGDRVEQLDIDGAIVASFPLPCDPRYGLTYLNGVVYVLGHPYGAPSDRIEVFRLDAATGAELGAWPYLHMTGSTTDPTIGTDGTYIAIARVSAFDNPYVNRYDPATGSLVDSTMMQNFPTRYGRHIRGLYYGNGDFGTPTIVLATSEGAMLSWNTDGTRRIDDWLNAHSNSLAGLAWDGIRFYALTPSSRLYGFSHIRNSGGDTDDWWIAHTWRDAAGHETLSGPATRFTQYRRASIIVKTPPIPDGADRVGVYLARTSVTPTRSDLHRVDINAPGETTLRLDDATLTGTNPPEANTFPDATPAQVASGRGDLVLTGAGELHAPRKMQCGTVTITPVPDTPTAVPVTFRVPFTVTPVVVVTPWTGVPGTRVLEASATDPTTNGFTAVLTRTNNTTTAVFWLAMAPDP